MRTPPMKSVSTCFAIVLSLASTMITAEEYRPPAVPLVACDPYFSIWSRQMGCRGRTQRTGRASPIV